MLLCHILVSKLPFNTFKWKSRLFFVLCVSSVVAWSGAVGFYLTTKIVYYPASIQFAGEQATLYLPLPFVIRDAPTTHYKVSFNLDRGSSLSPTSFRIYPDDLLWSMKVNGRPVNDNHLPMPFNIGGETIEFGHYLNRGNNVISLELENYFGPAGLRIEAASTDWNTLFILCVALCAMLLSFETVVIGFNCPVSFSLRAVIFGAVAVRLIYFSATPYNTRAYDWDAHISYVQYLIRHLALPEPHSGWETHQPPLYYGLLWLWATIAKVLALQNVFPIELQWQFISLVLSLATFGVCVWIVHLLYLGSENKKIRDLFLAAIAVFPGLVYHATRISNDVLFCFISFVWLALLVRFWRNRSFKGWCTIAVVIGIGMITKNCALAFIPPSSFCLLFAHNLYWRQQALWALTAVCIVLLLAGWFQLPRAIAERNATTFIVANMHQLDASLKVEHSLRKLLTFDPIEVMIHPFNSSRRDYPRHDFFMEYCFKSAFVGEWILPIYMTVVTRTLLLTGIVILSMSFCGMVCLAKRFESENDGIPLFLAFWCFLAMQCMWVWREPYSPNQDSRYFVVLIIPIIYFALSFVKGLPVSLAVLHPAISWFGVLNGFLFLILLSWM